MASRPASDDWRAGAGGPIMIPRLLHQSWKAEPAPVEWRPLQHGWRELNPDWTYRFWTDEDNRGLVARRYPELLALYDGYPANICRAELARYLVMREHGGVYVDLDFECLRPIEPLLRGHDLVVGLEPATHAARAALLEPGLDRIVCNAFLASAPLHPFWDHLLRRLAQTKGEANILKSTGTLVFTEACSNYNGDTPITVLPSPILYPADMDQSRTHTAFELKAMALDAYGIHYWGGSWWRDAFLQMARLRRARRQ